jgi:histidine ammonia-lyase
MGIILTGRGLTVEDVVAVARHGETVELAPEAVEAIRRCRTMLEGKLASREVMYGINTGIGEFSEVALDDEQVKSRQASGSLSRSKSCARRCSAGSTSTPRAIPVAAWRSLRRIWPC